jgi:hypothetical protein
MKKHIPPQQMKLPPKPVKPEKAKEPPDAPTPQLPDLPKNVDWDKVQEVVEKEVGKYIKKVYKI